jgi:hypothetical protein
VLRELAHIIDGFLELSGKLRVIDAGRPVVAPKAVNVNVDHAPSGCVVFCCSEAGVSRLEGCTAGVSPSERRRCGGRLRNGSASSEQESQRESAKASHGLLRRVERTNSEGVPTTIRPKRGFVTTELKYLRKVLNEASHSRVLDVGPGFTKETAAGQVNGQNDIARSGRTRAKQGDLKPGAIGRSDVHNATAHVPAAGRAR